MAKKNGVLLFYDWYPAFCELSPKDCKSLILDMYSIAMDGTDPNLEKYKGAALLAAGFMLPAVQRWRKISEKRSEAGSAGNASKWKNGGAAEESEACGDINKSIANESQTNRKRIASESVCDYNENRYKTKQNKTKQNIYSPLPPSSEGDAASAVATETTDDGFDRFWAAYPRKAAKKDARAAWSKIKPDETLLGIMLEAIQAKLNEPGGDWLREGGRFVPLPATWLRGERWNDSVVLGTETIGSFDTDEFFLDALKKTYLESAT